MSDFQESNLSVDIMHHGEGGVVPRHRSSTTIQGAKLKDAFNELLRTCFWKRAQTDDDRKVNLFSFVEGDVARKIVCESRPECITALRARKNRSCTLTRLVIHN